MPRRRFLEQVEQTVKLIRSKGWGVLPAPLPHGSTQRCPLPSWEPEFSTRCARYPRRPQGAPRPCAPTRKPMSDLESARADASRWAPAVTVLSEKGTDRSPGQRIPAPRSLIARDRSRSDWRHGRQARCRPYMARPSTARQPRDTERQNSRRRQRPAWRPQPQEYDPLPWPGRF